MKWEKLGLIFKPEENFTWMHTHASNATADIINDEIVRIYFSTRNQNNQSNIGFVEVDFLDSFRILRISTEPVLTFGSIGLFDDSGASLSCLLNYDNQKYLFYIGWNLSVTVPWRNSIGLAKYDSSCDKFIKTSPAPLLDRNSIDPFSLSYPYVIKDGHVFKMWYGSNLEWGKDQKDMIHVIKYAESIDIFTWKRDGIISLDLNRPLEYALSRPCVLKEDGVYKMWYSYRASERSINYRIGYAESQTGINWTRKDELVGIDVSKSGWDSEMICYPYVFDFHEKRYLLYNGNQYGKTGFGLAVLV